MLLEETFGPLKVVFEIENGLLKSIQLTARPPANFDRQSLLAFLRRADTFNRDESGLTPFIRSVYKHMQEIPIGSVLSYGALATASGSKGAARAVGQACRRNPWPLLIPCHRVVGSHSPGGYALGEDWKKLLLELEGVEWAGLSV